MYRNIYLLIAYDGTDFHGWQTQPNVRTVQEVLEQAIRRVVRHQIELIGSGRTDAGVHAAGQVANFLTTSNMPTDRLRHAIGSRLPKDVSIIEAHDVNQDFHATKSALSKLYRYRIHAAASRPVNNLTQRYTYHFWNPIQLAPMRAAAVHFVGQQDFAAMAARGSSAQTTVRTVLRCDIERNLDEVHVNVQGRGFLYNQVRNMVGTLLNVAVGRWDPDHVRTILDGKDRAAAGPTAPARGLCLQWVQYPSRLLLQPQASDNQEPTTT